MIDQFTYKFKRRPEVYATAPGRINLVGEHTDYNSGFVLPAAIDREINFLAAPRDDGRIVLWSENFREGAEFRLAELNATPEKSWTQYIKGAVWVCRNGGYKISGFDAWISGNVPLGSGLSSSAALEISVLTGLNHLFQMGLTQMEIAVIGQKVENEFVGVQCGLMDQFISVFGEVDSALLLDCLTLDNQVIPCRPTDKGFTMLVYDSKVQRELEGSEYNLRRNQAQSALEKLQKSGVASFRDLEPKDFNRFRNLLTDLEFRRARHVITENQRVHFAAEALKENDFERLGGLLFQSHESLRDDYEVSCPELNLLYDFGRDFFGCLGARMIGAGFGGSGLVLVRSGIKQKFIDGIQASARGRGYPVPQVFEVGIGPGARIRRI